MEKYEYKMNKGEGRNLVDNILWPDPFECTLYYWRFSN